MIPYLAYTEFTTDLVNSKTKETLKNCAKY